jgi:hypothetical protein
MRKIRLFLTLFVPICVLALAVVLALVLWIPLPSKFVTIVGLASTKFFRN